LLLQKPAVSRTQIAFVFAGDLWIVSRDGGEARRLTSGIGTETDPMFSPDGSQIAFTGEYDGNVDVFLVSSSGGVPRRLTYHPGADRAAGWTPDGKQVLFTSGRQSDSGRTGQLFTIPVDGKFPTMLPFPMAYAGHQIMWHGYACLQLMSEGYHLRDKEDSSASLMGKG